MILGHGSPATRFFSKISPVDEVVDETG